MSELTPVGLFELFVFRVANNTAPNEVDYCVQICVPDELRENADAWIEAAACLTGYAARHCDLGYEKTLEFITERTMTYRENPPPPPENSPLISPPN